VDRAVFPGQQGGSAGAYRSRKAVALGEALRPGVQDLCSADCCQCQGAGGALKEAGFRIVSGGTDNHLMLVDVFEKGILGSEAELALGQGGHHSQQECDPYDINPPLQALWHSHRHTGADHPRHEGTGDAADRYLDYTKPLEQRNDDAALERIRKEVAELANRFPLYAWRRLR